MAHFIKLTVLDEGGAYFNTDNIVKFNGRHFGPGSIVSVISGDQTAGTSAFKVKETPDQILALIAEAQGAK